MERDRHIRKQFVMEKWNTLMRGLLKFYMHNVIIRHNLETTSIPCNYILIGTNSNIINFWNPVSAVHL